MLILPPRHLRGCCCGCCYGCCGSPTAAEASPTDATPPAPAATHARPATATVCHACRPATTSTAPAPSTPPLPNLCCIRRALTNCPSPEATGKRPEDSSLLEPPCARPAHGHATGWFTRCRVEFPSTNPYNNHSKTNNLYHSTTIQQPYNNHNPLQQPFQNHTKPHKNPQDPKDGAGATPRHLRYGAAGEAGGLPEGPPPLPGPPRRRRRHPSPHCATARRGRPEA
jgi:hypothetical protein